MRVRQNAVVIDAVAAGDPNALRDALVALGMTHAAVYKRYVSGVLPIRALPDAARLAELRLARPAYARTRSGSVTSQGDVALGADLARSTYGIDGTGVVVGSLSDSYDCLGGAAGDVGSGDLPAGVVVLADEPGCGSGTDEGRAMMQIVSDVAPGASQAFHTAFGGIADFAGGIGELAAMAGAQVINDDVIYFAEPMFQDGVIAQAVDNVNAAGVAYFSSAGNDARHSYEDQFRPTLVSGTTRHDFDAGGLTDTMQSVTIPAQTQVIFVLQWDEPFFSVSGSPGSASDLDMILYSAQGLGLAGGVDNNVGGDPVEVFAYENKSGQARNYQLRITQNAGPAPGRVKYVYFGDLTVNEYASNSAALYGHPNAAGAAAVGAARYSQTPAFGVDPPLLEYFSSAGGTPILRDTAGAPILELRQKPDIVAPNGGDNTFFGGDYEPNGWPNFFGTSAAAPHAAGVAALMLGFDGNLTPAQIHSTMQATAIDMDIAGPDFNTGFGLVQADQALASLVDTTPDTFAFTDLVDVDLGTVQTSNAVTITGINTAAAVGVTGGEYSIGCGVVFTADPGTINDGETVCVRHTSAATNATSTDTTLTVGGVADTFTSTTTGLDTDGDGIPDSEDNCTLLANPTQCDSDGDNFGNHCDGDLNNSSFTNSQDYVLFRAQLGQPSVDPTYNQADLNCSGSVNSQDYVLFRSLLGSPPGPSGLVP